MFYIESDVVILSVFEGRFGRNKKYMEISMRVVGVFGMRRVGFDFV